MRICTEARSRDRTGRQTGISLLEMIIVLGVMAVVVGLAVEAYIVTHRFCAVGTNSTRALQTVRLVATKMTKDLQFYAGPRFVGTAGAGPWRDSLSFDCWAMETDRPERRTRTYDLDYLKTFDPDIQGVDFVYMPEGSSGSKTETWPGPGAPALVQVRLRLSNYDRMDTYETNIYVPKGVTTP